MRGGDLDPELLVGAGTGGGVSFYFKRRGAFDTSFLTKAWPRTLSEPLLGMEILGATDPPVRAVPPPMGVAGRPFRSQAGVVTRTRASAA